MQNYNIAFFDYDGYFINQDIFGKWDKSFNSPEEAIKYAEDIIKKNKKTIKGYRIILSAAGIGYFSDFSKKDKDNALLEMKNFADNGHFNIDRQMWSAGRGFINGFCGGLDIPED